MAVVNKKGVSMEVKDWLEGEEELYHFHVEHDELVWCLEGKLEVVTMTDSPRIEMRTTMSRSDNPKLIRGWVTHSIRAITNVRSLHIQRASGGSEVISDNDWHDISEKTEIEEGAEDDGRN